MERETKGERKRRRGRVGDEWQIMRRRFTEKISVSLRCSFLKTFANSPVAINLFPCDLTSKFFCVRLVTYTIYQT